MALWPPVGVGLSPAPPAQRWPSNSSQVGAGRLLPGAGWRGRGQQGAPSVVLAACGARPALGQRAAPWAPAARAGVRVEGVDESKRWDMVVDFDGEAVVWVDPIRGAVAIAPSLSKRWGASAGFRPRGWSRSAAGCRAPEPADGRAGGWQVPHHEEPSGRRLLRGGWSPRGGQRGSGSEPKASAAFRTSDPADPAGTTRVGP